ncbi:MAG TPA: alpha/beta hydrolase, partial [Moraxellaceae bacterium]|nr:alpha/beta hydrolase [Moraxellaceae bacterium]
YHDVLQTAGAPSQLVHFADMPHAFLNMENLCPEQCKQLYQNVGEFCQ